MSEILIELLEDLEEEKLKEFLRATTLITDPLGQELLKKAAESPSNTGKEDH